QLGAERIAESHIVNGKSERLVRRAYECGQPRHDVVRGLFAFCEEEHRKIVHYEMLSRLAKADNAISATHTRCKCLILLPRKYAIGAIPSPNSWPITLAICEIAAFIDACLHARFATALSQRCRLKESISTIC